MVIKMKNKVLAGFIMITAAILLIADSLGNSLGIFPIDLPIFKFLLCIPFIIWAIKKPKHIFLPAAFIFIILQKNISEWCNLGGERFISAWIVIICAVLLHVGMLMIFSGAHKSHLIHRIKSSNSKLISGNTE